MADEGDARRAPRRSSSIGRPQPVPLRRASSASRSPRWASASWASPRSPTLFEPLFGDLSPRPRGRDLGRDRLPDRHRAAHHRSASRSPRSTRSSTPRRSRCASRGRSTASTRRCAPFIVGAQRRRPTRILRAARRRPRRRRSRRARRPRSCKALIAQSRAGGKLDPGEAGMLAGVFHLHEQEARQVMTPIPAVVTVDLSEDVETALRRCVSSGHTRLVVTEDDNRDRVRGIVHSNSLARAADGRGPARVDRAARARGAHRPRDQAAGRPARRPAARSAPRWPSSSTSTAASSAS